MNIHLPNLRLKVIKTDLSKLFFAYKAFCTAAINDIFLEQPEGNSLLATNTNFQQFSVILCRHHTPLKYGFYSSKYMK